jgi:hypothetical protein
VGFLKVSSMKNTFAGIAEGLTDNKNPEYYRSISLKYCKRKTLLGLYKENPSLKSFIEEIQSKSIVIEEDDF